MSVLTDVSTRELFQALFYREQLLFLNVQNKVNLDARYRIFLRKIIYKITGIIYVIFLIIYKKKKEYILLWTLVSKEVEITEEFYEILFNALRISR